MHFEVMLLALASESRKVNLRAADTNQERLSLRRIEYERRPIFSLGDTILYTFGTLFHSAISNRPPLYSEQIAQDLRVIGLL